MIEQDAAAAEEKSDFVSAAELYEKAVVKGAPLDTLINLAVLYWQATDYGFWTGHHLPREFVDRAGERMNEILDIAAQRFPGAPEVEFWKRYIAWADLGEELDPDDCRRLLQQKPDYLEPSVYLLSATREQEYRTQAQRLLEHYRGQRTTRAKYITTVIESALLQNSQVV